MSPSIVQGADFGAAAREKIEEKLRKGMTLAEIEYKLKNPDAKGAPPKPKEEKKPKEERKQEVRAAVVEAPPKEEEKKKAKEEVKPPPPPPAPKSEPAVVGQSLGAGKRDPMTMIKVCGGWQGGDCSCTAVDTWHAPSRGLKVPLA